MNISNATQNAYTLAHYSELRPAAKDVDINLLLAQSNAKALSPEDVANDRLPTLLMLLDEAIAHPIEASEHFHGKASEALRRANEEATSMLIESVIKCECR